MMKALILALSLIGCGIGIGVFLELLYIAFIVIRMEVFKEMAFLEIFFGLFFVLIGCEMWKERFCFWWGVMSLVILSTGILLLLQAIK